MQGIPDDSEYLKALIRPLWVENERLKDEPAELRRRLGLDSTHSHKPPVAMGTKRKRPHLASRRKKGGAIVLGAPRMTRWIEYPMKLIRYRMADIPPCVRIDVASSLRS